jgi:hypothetical protein
MSKILAGVFLGVFVSALFYEILKRQEPEIMGKFTSNIRNKLSELLEPGEAMES